MRPAAVTGSDPPPGEPSQARPRRGRPRQEDAGEVDGRVLEAATALFLEQGFARTTLDAVAQRARTSKATLYGRYRDKEALFAAVVRCSVNAMLADLAVAPVGATQRERLRHVGLELARSLLQPRCVALMRITAGEAESFPDLARLAYEVSFEGSVRAVADALGLGGSDAERGEARRAAESFVEVGLQPLSFQVMFGWNGEEGEARVRRDVEGAIALLSATGLLPG